MRSIKIKNNYGLENIVIDEASLNQPLSPNEIKVNVKFLSLNQLDLMIANGAMEHALPHQLGSDIAGVVEEIGTNVSEFKVGDTVTTHFIQGWQSGNLKQTYFNTTLGIAEQGVFAEQIILPETSFIKTPKNTSLKEASTLPIAGLTAWESIVTIGKVKKGETILLKGTGGVAIFALQFAKIIGAKVIITSSSDEKLSLAKELGADITINYKTNKDWPSKVLEATEGEGVDYVLETVWSEMEKSTQATKFGGRIIGVGVLKGHETKISFYSIAQKDISIKTLQTGPKSSFELMNNFIDLHKMKPVISRTFELAQITDAFTYLSQGKHLGKIVVEL